MPRRRVRSANEVDPAVVPIDSIPASTIRAPLLLEPYESDFKAELAGGQYLHEANVPLRGLFEFRDVSLVMPESVVVFRGRILRESVPIDHFLDTVYFVADWFRRRPAHSPVAKATFLLTIPIARNYHLWVHYALPRLLFWERLENRAEVVTLIPEDAPGFVAGALDLYRARHPEFRYERVPRSRITVERLFLAQPMSDEDLPNPIAVEWLRETFLPAAPVLAERSILVSRKGALEREVLNEDELLRVLEPFGFERFDPAKATFEEQIRAFSTARRIVAPHGAALASLAFAPKDAHIVELLGGSHVFSCFRFLSAEIGAQYDAVACTTVGVHMEVDKAQRATIVRLLQAREQDRSNEI